LPPGVTGTRDRLGDLPQVAFNVARRHVRQRRNAIREAIFGTVRAMADSVAWIRAALGAINAGAVRSH
jgi:hypothetical protein